MSEFTGPAATRFAALALTTLLTTTSALAAVWDLSDDFSPTVNPAGEWSYRYSSTLVGPTTPFPDSGEPHTVGVAHWWDEAAFGWITPSVAHNEMAIDVDMGGGVIFPANGVVLHPGSAGEFAIVRWVAPTSTSYRIDAYFELLDSGQTDATVLHNGAIIFADTISGGASSTFTTTLILAAGDTVDFAVGYSGNHHQDSTLLAVTITDDTTTAAPETGTPQSIAGIQSYPSPFVGPEVTLEFDLRAPAPLTMDIFDVRGARVRSLIGNRAATPGLHRARWDGADDAGRALPAGVYFARLVSGRETRSHRITMLR